MTLLFPYSTESSKGSKFTTKTLTFWHSQRPYHSAVTHQSSKFFEAVPSYVLESCPWIWGDLSPEFSKRETVHSVVEQRVVAVVVLQIVNKVLQCCKCFQANDKIQHGILNEGYDKTGPKTKYQSALVYLSLFASTQVNQTYCPRITIAIVLIHRFLLTLPWQESSSIL